MIFALLLGGKRVPERLHLLLQARLVAAWVGEEREQESLHPVGAGEVRPRVAVDVLRDLLRLAPNLHGLLGPSGVLAGAGVGGRSDGSRGVLPERDLGRTLGHELHERLALTE